MSSAATEGGFGSTLKGLRRRRGLTQAKVAEAVQVSRATIAQWEAGSHLPSSERSLLLDDFFRASGTLSQLAEQERDSSTRSLGVPGHQPKLGPSLLMVFRHVQAALEEHMARDDDGRPLGWCQNLQSRVAPRPVATAFGIKAMLLIEEAFRANLGSLARSLRNQALSDGGWAASSQTTSRPEAIAVVIDALVRVDPTSDMARPLELLEAKLDDVARQRPSIMTTVLETVLDLRPDSPLATDLIRSLLDARHVHDPAGRELWSQKAEPALVSPEPSVAHTARAVCVLARAQTMGLVAETLAGEVQDAVAVALDWLLSRSGSDLDNTSENVERTVDGRTEVLYLRHFTPSWVLRAVLLAGERPTHPTALDALDHMWRYYSDGHSLWRWETGDLPVWMTFDAVAALRLAALASFTPSTARGSG
jgi:transcriptional regulator with XRE-family HTH domain